MDSDGSDAGAACFRTPTQGARRVSPIGAVGLPIIVPGRVADPHHSSLRRGSVSEQRERFERAGCYGLLVPMPALTKDAGTSNPGRGVRHLRDFTALHVLRVPPLPFFAVSAAWLTRSAADRRRLVVPLTRIVSGVVAETLRGRARRTTCMLGCSSRRSCRNCYCPQHAGPRLVLSDGTDIDLRDGSPRVDGVLDVQDEHRFPGDGFGITIECCRRRVRTA